MPDDEPMTIIGRGGLVKLTRVAGLSYLDQLREMREVIDSLIRTIEHAQTVAERQEATQ
jgi:hypothetical protein